MSLVIMALAGLQTLAPTPSEPRYYFFLSDQRIVTVEVVNDRKAVLNYINLGDTFELLEAPGLLVLTGDGRAYGGRFIEVEAPASPEHRFKISELVSPRRFIGWNILGKYPSPPTSAEVFVRVGSRVVQPEEVSRDDFNLLASRIESLDLSMTDGRQMVLQAGFRRGYGDLHASGSERTRALEAHFPDLRLLPPVVLANPQPRLPQAFAHLTDPVEVEVTGTVNRAGGITGLRVKEGRTPELDALALEAVRNNWEFLPAVSDGEVAESEVTVVVTFGRR